MPIPIKKKPAGRYSRLLSLLSPIFRRYRLRLALGFAALLLVDGFQLMIPRVIKSAVDSLGFGSADKSSLVDHGLLIVGLALGVAVFRFFWRFLIIGFSRLLERDIRDMLFSHLLSLDRSFFQRKPAGKLMALATNDLTAVQMACGMGMVALTDAVVMVVAALAFMIYIHPMLTLVALLPMPILVILTKGLAGKLHDRFRKVQEQFSTLTEFARAAVTSIRLVKVYTREEMQGQGFNTLGRQYIKDNIKVARVQGFLFPLSGLIANCCLLLIVYFGGRLTIQQTITIGDFVAFISYLFMLTWPMMAFGWVANIFQRGVTSLERISDVLEEQPVFDEANTESAAINNIERITLHRLSFTYPGQDEPVLRQIDLTMEHGLFGIVGPTGSGKSTLCHLLARLYPVAEKTIFLNSIDINAIPLAQARGLVSLAAQESFLFSESVAFNIGLSKPGASQEEIEQVARLAVIHDEIMALPKGYQTRIGEKGVKLSGGQRQRLALARALLADTPVLIIDDGLSAVDVDTENAILNNLTEVFAQRLVIFVCNRLAPLGKAQKIAVLEEGRITALGREEELLATNRFFQTIHKHQNRAS